MTMTTSVECSDAVLLTDISLDVLKKGIRDVQNFLSISLSIANAHTVDFYTHDVWDKFIAVPPENVLSAINSSHDSTVEPKVSETTTFGFSNDTSRLVDVSSLLQAAKTHSIPGLGICLSRGELLQILRDKGGDYKLLADDTEVLQADEFMNCKKAHEVRAMSEVVAALAKQCKVNQVIDVGSGKGYLCSYLSMQHQLQVFGIDSSATNTHGAQERNRKLKKFSRAYQGHNSVGKSPLQSEMTNNVAKEKCSSAPLHHRAQTHVMGEEERQYSDREIVKDEEVEQNIETFVPLIHAETTANLPLVVNDRSSANQPGEGSPDRVDTEPQSPHLAMLLPDLVEQATQRVPPSEISQEERERRKRENLERKARRGKSSNINSILFSPLTSFVTAATELTEIVPELKDAVMVGLHTCGDLASSTLQMFVAKQELHAVCSVGCCYHLLTEEFDSTALECARRACGFPMSQYLRDQAYFCGRNARMSACLALERVTVGGGLPMESLFFRAVLHVILRDHYGAYKSEKRVGNVYSKACSFVDYARRALKKLELDDSKLSDSSLQGYHDFYKPRMNEMVAFNMLKVVLAPCIEGLILLDRLCYLKEQENVPFSALVRLFDPLMSPRCYGVIGLKVPKIA